MNGEETLIAPVVHKTHYEASELDGVDTDDQELFSNFQLDVIAQAIVELRSEFRGTIGWGNLQP
jgi:hypothetical protein